RRVHEPGAHLVRVGAQEQLLGDVAQVHEDAAQVSAPLLLLLLRALELLLGDGAVAEEQLLQPHERAPRCGQGHLRPAEHITPRRRAPAGPPPPPTRDVRSGTAPASTALRRRPGTTPAPGCRSPPASPGSPPRTRGP